MGNKRWKHGSHNYGPDKEDDDSNSHKIQKINGIKMKVSSKAQRKLIAAATMSERVNGGTEVRGGIFIDPQDPWYIKDVCLMGAKEASGAHVESGGDDQIALFKEWINAYGIDEAEAMNESMKGDWHKHPGGGHAYPSGTDTTCVLTRMQNYLEQEYYPFLITNNKGEISAFVCIKFEKKNSVIKMNPEYKLFELDVELIYDEEDQEEQQKVMDELVKLESTVEKLENKKKELLEELDKKKGEIGEKFGKEINSKKKEIDSLTERLSSTITPSEELQQEMLADIINRLPSATVTGGNDSDDEKKDENEKGNTLGSLTSDRTYAGRCSLCLRHPKFCVCDERKKPVPPSEEKNETLVEKKEDDEESLSFLSDTFLHALIQHHCPETDLRIRSNDCFECPYRAGPICGLGFIQPMDKLMMEEKRRERNTLESIHRGYNEYKHEAI